MLGIQATGNSNSIRGFWTPLRRAGAGLGPASSRLPRDSGVSRRRSVERKPSVVLHETSGRKLPYGSLATAAAAITPPAELPLKSPRDFG